MTMEISGENYHVAYDPTTTTITCQGTFRLRGAEEYAPIAQLLDQAAGEKPERIALNLRKLRFLNSSGIAMLSKFVIKVRNLDSSRLVIRGTPEFSWQEKSLPNLQRLMPDLTLEFENDV